MKKDKKRVNCDSPSAEKKPKEILKTIIILCLIITLVIMFLRAIIMDPQDLL